MTNRACKIEGCSGVAVSRSLCGKHYTRLKRHGDALIVLPRPNCKGRANPNYRHGGAGTKLNAVWKHMKGRCQNPESKSYDDYGGRGIKVCKRWLDFDKFAQDMGDTYKEGLTIERIDVNGDYEPSNCTWIKKSLQSRNRRDTVIVTYNGNKVALVEVAEEVGLPYGRLYNRVQTRGLPLEIAIKNEDMRKYNRVKKADYEKLNNFFPL